MVTHLGSHELRSTTERARRQTEPHLLLAQTVIGHLDVTVQREQNVIELQIAVQIDVLVLHLLIRVSGLTGR